MTIRRTLDPAGQTFCVEPHTYGPANPARWPAWAALMRATHEQHQCPDCGSHAIWRPINAVPAAEPEQLGFDTEESA